MKIYETENMMRIYLIITLNIPIEMVKSIAILVHKPIKMTEKLPNNFL